MGGNKAKDLLFPTDLAKRLNLCRFKDVSVAGAPYTDRKKRSPARIISSCVAFELLKMFTTSCKLSRSNSLKHLIFPFWKRHDVVSQPLNACANKILSLSPSRD